MISLLKLIRNCIKRFFGFLNDHGDVVAKGTAVGSTVAAAGVGANIWANKVNKKALAIREKAILAFQDSNAETEIVLGKLGDFQIKMVRTFDTFVEIMEKIQQRPEGLKIKFAKVSLTEYKPEELKHLSNNLQMAIVGAGGTAVGMGVGIAAFGINTLALGPGVLVGGVVLCVKGMSLSKKAIKNMHEAKQIKKDVAEIKAYHSQLRKSADMLYQAMEEVQPQYTSHLSALKSLVSRKTDYKTYTKDEQLLVRDAIMLVTLMHEMCKVELVQKAENERRLETVNEKKVKQVVKSVKSSLPKIKPILETLAV